MGMHFSKCLEPACRILGLHEIADDNGYIDILCNNLVYSLVGTFNGLLALPTSSIPWSVG